MGNALWGLAESRAQIPLNPPSEKGEAKRGRFLLPFSGANPPPRRAGPRLSHITRRNLSRMQVANRHLPFALSFQVRCNSYYVVPNTKPERRLSLFSTGGLLYYGPVCKVFYNDQRVATLTHVCVVFG